MTDFPFNQITDHDVITNDTVTIDALHNQIHQGQYFYSEDYSSYTNGQAKTFLIVTGANSYPHSLPNCYGAAEIEFMSQEGVTTSNDGTPMTILNRNRNANITSSITVFANPTVSSTAGAVTLRHLRVGSGKVYGGDTANETEIILKPNTKYLITITNGSTSTQYITTHFNWYEPK